MAFNPQVPTDIGRDYTGQSQGTKDPWASLGTLFEGIGKAGAQYVAAADEQQVSDINQSADKQVQSLLNNTVGPVGTEAQDIASGGQKMAKLQQAYNEGKLNDFGFYSKAAQISTGLRNKYPHRGPEIDSAVMGAIGRSPANRVREELNQQFASENSSVNAEMKQRQTKLLEWAGDGKLGRAGFSDPAGIDVTDPVQWAKVVNGVAQRASADSSLAAARAKIELDNANKTLDKEFVADTARKEVSMRTHEFMAGVGGGLAQWTEQYKAFGQGGFTPDEIQQLTQQAQLAKVGLTQGIIQSLADPAYDTMKPEDKKAILDEQIHKFDEITTSVLNGENGLKNASKNFYDMQINGIKSDGIKRLYADKNLEPVALAMSLEQLGISPEMKTYIMDKVYGPINNGLFTKEQTTAIQGFASGLITGQIKDGAKEIENMSTDPSIPGGVYKEITKQVGIILNDPSTPPEVLNEVMKNIIGERDQTKLLEKFGKGATREEVFRSIANPALAEKLKAYPDTLSTANMFVRKSFGGLIQPALADINGVQLDPKYIDIQFDPATGHFNVTGHPPAPPITQFPASGNPMAMDATAKFDMITGQLNYIKERIGFINQYADSLYAFSKAAGDDPGQALNSLYHSIQIPENWKLPKDMIEGALSAPDGETQDDTPVKSSAGELIKSFEGFTSTAKYDVNAHRAGYGSDTVTSPDGAVKRVTAGTKVSRADAERDLQRRIGAFQTGIIGDIGEDTWKTMNPHQQAALTSVAYNYGELPRSVTSAVKSGNLTAVADAIQALGRHNHGINRKRRRLEASLILQ